MTRHEIREHIFCLIFQNNFYPVEEFNEQMDNYLNDKKDTAETERFLDDKQVSMTEKEANEIREKVQNIIERISEIDEKISSTAIGWKIERIAKAELAILRLAIYEALYDESVPVQVAINEAVELAKAYGEDNGASFVNGILGNIIVQGIFTFP